MQPAVDPHSRTGAVARRVLGEESQQDMPLVLTKRNYKRVMNMIATPDGRIIYTTFIMDPDQR